MFPNFLQRLLKKFFEKPNEEILEQNTRFVRPQKLFFLYLRDDVPKPHVKYLLQTYYHEKGFKVTHTSASTMAVYQAEPLDRSVQIKIVLNEKNERLLHTQYRSKTEEDFKFFEEMFSEMGEVICNAGMLLGQKGHVEWNSGIKLGENVPLVTESYPSPYAWILSKRTHLLEDETKGTFAAFLNKEKKSEHIKHLFEKYCVDKGCQIVKNTTAVMQLLLIPNGKSEHETEPVTLHMMIGFNKNQQRILHGKYPKTSSLGKEFWVQFGEVLASNQCLLGQQDPFQLVPKKSTKTKNNSNSPYSPSLSSSSPMSTNKSPLSYSDMVPVSMDNGDALDESSKGLEEIKPK